MSGFRSFQQEQFSLSSAQNARVDARLAVGGLTEQVDVVANAIRVDTRSSAVVTTSIGSGWMSCRCSIAAC